MGVTLRPIFNKARLSPVGGGSLTIGTTPITGGADTQVLFNDGAFVGSDAGFVFTKTTAIATVTGGYTVTQTAATSGTPSALLILTGAAHTGLTAGAEIVDANFNFARTVQRATGAVATQRAFVIQAPTYSFVGASVITTAATLAVTGAPVAGTNATITTSLALWVQSGRSLFAGGASTTSSTTSEAFGLSASANNDNSVAFGPSATSNSHGVAIGRGASTVAGGGIAIGEAATAGTAKHFVAGSTATDAHITNVFIGNGITAAAPQNIVYNATGGSGTDVAGATHTIAGGKGTGAGLPGSVIFQTSTVGSTGTTLQSLATRAEITQLDGLKMSSRFQTVQGTDAASATNLTLTNDGNVFELTGTTKVDLISKVNWQEGSTIVLIANESVVIDHGTATSGNNVQIRLAGAVDYSMTAGDTLTLCLSSTTAEGQAWRELARTVI